MEASPPSLWCPCNRSLVSREVLSAIVAERTLAPRVRPGLVPSALLESLAVQFLLSPWQRGSATFFASWKDSKRPPRLGGSPARGEGQGRLALALERSRDFACLPGCGILSDMDSSPGVSGKPRRKRSHPWIDARSLAMACAIADKVRRDPTLIERVHGNLTRWRMRLDPWPQAYREWEHLLWSLPLDEILDLLVEDTEEGRRRRQSSPFTGILSARERREIFGHYEAIGA